MRLYPFLKIINSIHNGLGSKKMKKAVISIIIAAVFLLTALSICIPATSSDVDGAPSGNWNSGYASGSLPMSGSNYLINSAEDLARFSIEVNNGNRFDGRTILLTRNINISAHFFTPIGSDSNRFQGTFNGQNYEITGLSIEKSDRDNQGLFGVIGANSTIKNLGLIGSNVGGNNNVGTIAGINYGIIQHCYSKDGTFDGNEYAGGIVGNNSGIISNCYNKSKTTGQNYQTGGIAGINTNKIENCYNTGEIFGVGVGGITSKNSGTISHCYNTGLILGWMPYGITSINDNGIVSYCYNIGGLVPVQGGARGPLAPVNYTNSYHLNTGTGGLKLKTNYYELSGITATKNLNGFTTANWVFTEDDFSGSEYKVYFPQLRAFAVDGSPTMKADSLQSVEYVPGITKVSDLHLPPSLNKLSEFNYEIYDELDFIYFMTKINDGSYTATIDRFILRNDIHLYAMPIAPVGTVERPFRGTFEGGGHVIYGFRNDSANGNNQGVFGSIESTGKVTNLGLVNSIIRGNDNIGGIAGSNKGVIEGCYTNGSVSGNNDVGGLVGTSSGTINDCYNLSSVGGVNQVGGIAGSNSGNITACHNNAIISGTDNIGGIAGITNGTIGECYSMGSVSGRNVVGGLVGTNNGMINGCYNLSSVSGGDWIGGIAGSNNADKTIQRCFNSGPIQGNNNIGGITGSNPGKITDCYNTETITGTGTAGGIAGITSTAIEYCYNIGSITGTYIGPITGNGSIREGTCYWLNNFENGMNMDDMMGTDVLNTTMSALKDRGWASTPSVGSDDIRTSYRPQIFILADSKNPVIKAVSLKSVIHETGKMTPVIPHFEEYNYKLGEIVSSKALPSEMPQNVTGIYSWLNGDQRIVSLSTTIAVVFTPTNGSSNDYKEIIFYLDVRASLYPQNSRYVYTYGDYLSDMDPDENLIAGMGGKYVWSKEILLKSLGKQIVRMTYLPVSCDPIELDIEIDVLKPSLDGNYRYTIGEKLQTTDTVGEKTIGTIKGQLKPAEDVVFDSLGSKTITILFIPNAADCEILEFQIDVSVDPIPIKDNSRELIIACAIIITGAIISICYILRKW